MALVWRELSGGLRQRRSLCERHRNASGRKNTGESSSLLSLRPNRRRASLHGRTHLIASFHLIWYTVNHPIRLRIAPQMVIEELLHSHRDVLLIRALRRIVDIVIVIDEIHFFVQSPEGDEHLNALIPGYGIVG